MSYEIEYRHFAIKVDLSGIRQEWLDQHSYSGGRGNEIYFFYVEAGCSNLWDGNRRARDWYCTGWGTRQDILDACAGRREGIAGGGLRFRGATRTITPSGYYRAYERALDAALTISFDNDRDEWQDHTPTGFPVSRLSVSLHEAGKAVSEHPYNAAVFASNKTDSFHLYIPTEEAERPEAIFAWALDCLSGDGAKGELTDLTPSSYWCEQAIQTTVNYKRQMAYKAKKAARMAA